MGVELLTERYRNQIAGILILLRPDHYSRDVAEVVLCQWHDQLFLRAPDQDFRLPEVGAAATGRDPGEYGTLARENGIEIEFVRSAGQRIHAGDRLRGLNLLCWTLPFRVNRCEGLFVAHLEQ